MPVDQPTRTRTTGVDQSEATIVSTSEGRLAFHEVGSATIDATGQPSLPLVMLHGFTGHRDDFIGEMDVFGAQRRVIAADLRGHGDSENAEGQRGWCFEQLVADLAALLDTLEIDRIDLLGHSVGGFVALRFALAHPERVNSLIFMCTAPETPGRLNPKGFHAGAGLAEARGMDGLQGPAAAVIRANPFQGLPAWGDAERYFAHHERRHVAMSPASYRQVGTMFFESESIASRLGEIDVPCLVLVGAQDVDWLPGADLFEAGLRDVRRETIAGAEHHPHQENRAVFLAQVQHFLSDVAARNAA